MQKGLTGFQLKAIALIAMFFDHIAWAFVDTGTLLGQMMHFVGRLTGPTMCFFIAEGYRKTRSFPRYLLRLGVFALISQLPFTYYSMGRPGLIPLNVIYTLALGLLAIHCLEVIPNEGQRWAVIALLIFLSMWADWSVFGVLLCLAFYTKRDDWPRLAFVLTVMAVVLTVGQTAAKMSAGLGLATALGHSWFHLGMVLNAIVLPLYNGERGGPSWGRWMFYVFYPLHLAVIALLRWRFLV